MIPIAALLEYKCPCCGGAIEFNSQLQKMKCPYCDTEFDMETMKQYDEEVNQPREDEMHWDTAAGGEWEQGETDGMQIYVCKSCGGEIVAHADTAATSCPYCGNPVVMERQFAGDLRPDYVIPFKLDKDAAKRALKKHFSGKPLLPKVFQDENHIDEIKGVYVPFWLFDTDADAHIRYRATRIRSWSDHDYDYTETSFFSVLRGGSISFERVPVDGSQRMPDDMMESIEPFDFSEAVDFQTAYLAGYLADRYDVGAEQSIDRANERVRNSTEEEFAHTVDGYATVTPESTNIRLNNGQAKYALYPVWILNTSWKGQNYTFAMNGQTGKMVGDLPMDKSAYRKWLWGLTGIIGAVALGLMFLIHLL